MKGDSEGKMDFPLMKQMEASALQEEVLPPIVVIDGAGVLCPRGTGDFLFLHINGLSAVTTGPMALMNPTWGLSHLLLPFDPELYLSSVLWPWSFLRLGGRSVRLLFCRFASAYP